MKILLVEDNPELTQNVVHYLTNEGVVCEAVGNLFEAEDRMLIHSYDCILLDIMLPDGNGLSLIEKIKGLGGNTPVLIISAKDSLEDKLMGLNLGADDYLPKPFHLAELLARIKAIVRRSKFDGKDELVFREICVDHENRQVRVQDNLVDLTPKEFDLLVFFITNKNRVLGKQAIAQHLWGDYTHDLDNLDFVYQHVKNLRKKICAAGGTDYLSTVYGLGYKLDEHAR
ncbi:response regulator transcription factor [Lunatimonas salinarum]|uniref:response regulator transcription factor n=1 Tax=Lunatimonas salinarum TaxID=1774590 RepID=UPI001AE091D5|nr:response regulator transcription factor [Lunatimonas salinarum]